MRETLIKNSRRTVAASPEEDLQNFCDIPLPTAIESIEESIEEVFKLYSNITQNDNEWITSERIKLSIVKFKVGKRRALITSVLTFWLK